MLQVLFGKPAGNRGNIHIIPSPPSNTFERLPSELILSITEFLSFIDTTVLSLSHPRFYRIFLQYSKWRTGEVKNDRFLVLNRWQRDLPDYFACDVCKVFHKCDDGSDSFGLSGLPHERTCLLPCVQNGRWFQCDLILRTHATLDHSAYRFSYLQLKLAMKRSYYGSNSGVRSEFLAFTQIQHHQDPDRPKSGISSDSLAFTQIRHHQDPHFPDRPFRISLFAIETKIFPFTHRLYIRMQDIFLLRSINDLSRCRIPRYGSELYAIELCRHKGFLSLIIEMENIWDLDKIDSLQDGEQLVYPMHCPFCPSDMEICFKNLDGRIAMTLTRWIYLGSGLTMDDGIWDNHVYFRGSCFQFSIHPFSIVPRGTVRTFFENITEISVEELKALNLSYLKDQSYRNGHPFVAAGPNFWYIPYSDNSAPVRSKFSGIIRRFMAIFPGFKADESQLDIFRREETENFYRNAVEERLRE